MPGAVSGGGMRQLILTLAVGAFLGMNSLAAQQAPLGILPSVNALPNELPSRPPFPSQAGPPPRAERAGPITVSSLQSQLETQQRDVDSLIKTVQLLTEKMQRTVGTEAEPSGPEQAPSQSGAVKEEMEQAERDLAELRRQQAAAAQAPTADQMQKQLDLQRRQIEVLNRMIQLLASRLEQLNPAVNRLQTLVATLQARSRQSALRDQEVANGLDNLTEHIDATQRYGPPLPAPLKELFLPSGTNETPLSIYNALDLRYNEFTSQKGFGKFQFIEYDPIFLLQLNNQFLFEAQLEVHTDGIEPEFAQIDWMATDWFTGVLGRFMTPIGSLNERLHYLWINKLPDYPIFGWAVVPFDFNLNGAQARGATYLFGTPLKLEYALYVANGFGIPGAGAVTDFAGIQGQTDSSKSINNAIAYGGRTGIWIPPLGFNGGISYFGSRPYSLNADGVNIDIWDVDLNYHMGNWDARFEGAQTFQKTAFFIGHNMLLQGLYAQLAYRPYHVANPYLQKTEAVVRYSVFRGSGYIPGQIDLTAFTFPNQAPISRNQYTFGLNYYPYPSMALRLAYEINQEIGFNLRDNVVMVGFAWGF